MKISIDLDGCLWHHQAFFRALMIGMQNHKHEVGILTAHKIIHREADVALMEKRGFPKPDFYIGRPLDGRPADYTLYGRPADYTLFKAMAISTQKIDIHFDDRDAEQIRNRLGPDGCKVISVLPRGREDEHFE